MDSQKNSNASLIIFILLASIFVLVATGIEFYVVLQTL